MAGMMPNNYIIGENIMKQLTFPCIIIMFMLFTFMFTECCTPRDTEQMNDSQPVMEVVNIDERKRRW